MKLIGLTGYKGSGKTTVARYLEDRHGYTRLPFAAVIKDMLRAMGLSEEQVNGDLKETPSELLCGKTPRFAMQTLGTEWGRDTIGKDLWLNMWSARAAPVHKVVVDDIRFLSEAQRVIGDGGIVVRVNRPDTVGDGHSSETELDRIFPHYEVYNHNEKEVLFRRVDTVLLTHKVRMRQCNDATKT